MASKKKADDSNSKPKTKKPVAKAAGKPRAAEAAPTAATATAVAAPTGKVVVERMIGGRMLTLETGRMAKLSDGACVARYGDTMVLATVNSAKAPEGIDFFPLTVDYREKTSAAGVIPGGFFKREGRPSTKEILACRIIDRSIRPMFPDGFRREVQVLSQVFSTDRENDPDVLAAIASFAALALSSVPCGPALGMVRIGCVNEKLTVNPLWSEIQSEANTLNLTVAGHKDAIAMVEAGAKQVTEELMLQALELAHDNCKQIAAMIAELTAKAGKPKMAFAAPVQDAELVKAIEAEFGAELRSAPLTPGTKQMRSAATKAAKEKAAKKFHAPHTATPEEAKVWNSKVGEILGDIVKDAERQSILKGRRADGRDHTTVRPITIEVGVLPRVHGSVLFTRGETQALGVVTLGGTDDQQIIDGLMPEPKKRFLLHYNFPPFSVGEVKRVGTPGRREIGHGALAERGLEAVLPGRDEFPYTIRITSEILESNGSSSMATACSGTLAMMDAGVPIKQPVAGIAMGLVMEGKKYAILTDILGSEDACGDMDFKVVGTGKGITALQMDIKCEGLTREIMAEALEQAKQGRLHVLREMLKALAKPRAEISPNAPRLESLTIPSEKIGLIIGPGGKNIRAMQETYDCKISIEDGGMCTVTGLNSEKVKAAVAHIKAMTAEVELGALYEGRVTAIKEFGAFVEILPSQEGLVHVSELSDGFIRAVTDVVRIGDTLKVKVIAIDDFGKVKLSRKAVILAERGAGGGAPAAAAPGAATPAAPAAAPEGGAPAPREERRERFEPRGDRGDRGDRPDRGPRPERGERFDRPDRGPRPERGDRPEREDRPERGERWDRPQRPDRPDRPDRPERSDRPMREERADRPEGEARPPRPEWSDRPERPRQGERNEERPFREREDRPRHDRPERGERFPREREEQRGPQPPMDRPDRDRGDRGPRDERRPPREPREGFDRPAREERAPRPEPAGRPERGERFERGDRGDRGDRPQGERFERRPERGPRDEGRPERGERSEGWRPRRDEPALDRPERRPMRDAAAPRDAGAPRDAAGFPPAERSPRPDRGPRPERSERPARPETGERAPRPEGAPARPERGDRPDRDRGGRGFRSEMPMAEFEDDNRETRETREPTPPAQSPDRVGQLESLDSVLGDEPRGPRRDRRRHRD